MGNQGNEMSMEKQINILKKAMSDSLNRGMRSNPDHITLQKDIVIPTKYHMQKTQYVGQHIFILSNRENDMEDEELTTDHTLEVDGVGHKVIAVGKYRGVKDSEGVVDSSYYTLLTEEIDNYVPLSNRDFKSSAEELRKVLDGHPLSNSLLDELMSGAVEVENDSVLMSRFLKKKGLYEKYLAFKESEMEKFKKEIENND